MPPTSPMPPVAPPFPPPSPKSPSPLSPPTSSPSASPTAAPTRPPFCLKVVTGTGSNHDGNLQLHINTGSGLFNVAAGWFELGDTVYDECFAAGLWGVQVIGPTANAWAGSVLYSVDGGATYSALDCVSNTCSGTTTTTSLIAVDGNADALDISTTMCVDGGSCDLHGAGMLGGT